jgi:predicted amidohydrolase
VKARALENRVPVVSVNFLLRPEYPGRSLIVKLTTSRDRRGEEIVYPEVAKKGAARQEVLIAELDLDEIKPQRDERLNARRPETYSRLLQSWDPQKP